MQTFLPYPDFVQTARCLDDVRLGNQCYREGKTLLGGGWPNHPAAKMWKGYEWWLAYYCYILALEIGKRSYYKPGVSTRWVEYFGTKVNELPTCEAPPWLGDPEFHASHRSNLLRKDPIWYGQFGWTEPEDLPYVWPTGKIERKKIIQIK